MEPQTYIFAGPSGSGKGTQVERLKEVLATASDNPLHHFYTGDHFRSYMRQKSDTHAAALSQQINDVGGLQPSFLAIWLWSEDFVKNLTGAENLIIDGSPRTVLEAQALDGAMRFYRRSKPHVILIDVSKEEAERRLMERGRGDDTKDSIDRRLGWYESEVKPAVDMYRDNADYQFHEINGEQSIEAVTRDILETLDLT